MKFQAELRDSPEVEAWLAAALGMGLLVSFQVLEEKERQAKTDHEPRTPTPLGAPFKHGQPVVVVKTSALYPDISIGDAGVVRSIFRRGRGWAAEVDWDDNTSSTLSAGMLQ